MCTNYLIGYKLTITTLVCIYMCIYRAHVIIEIYIDVFFTYKHVQLLVIFYLDLEENTDANKLPVDTGQGFAHLEWRQSNLQAIVSSGHLSGSFVQQYFFDGIIYE